MGVKRGLGLAQALRYARASAAVRACAVKLDATPFGKLNCELPFVGQALEAQILEVLETGTCKQLEQFKCACCWGPFYHTCFKPASPYFTPFLVNACF